MNVAMKNTNHKDNFSDRKRKDSIFLFTILILPILQFIVFYIIVLKGEYIWHSQAKMLWNSVAEPVSV